MVVVYPANVTQSSLGTDIVIKLLVVSGSGTFTELALPTVKIFSSCVSSLSRSSPDSCTSCCDWSRVMLFVLAVSVSQMSRTTLIKK